MAPVGVIETLVPEIEVTPPETVKPAAAVKAAFVTSSPDWAKTLPAKVEVAETLSCDWKRMLPVPLKVP